MKRGLLLLMGLTLALSACASSTDSAHLPYRSWYLSFSGVPYMEVWVEDARITDLKGRVFHGYQVGVASMSYHGNPAGWASSSGYGKGRNVIGAALPKQIYVRWQSLAEPQTYQATINIPASVRKLMLTQGPPDPKFKHPNADWRYFNRMNLGLAPGGWIKIWLGSVEDGAIPVMCIKAKVDPVGPYGGKSHGKYRPLSKKAAAYIASHTIPYASWNCKKH